MSKDSSAKYYPNNKDYKKTCERYQILSKEGKEKKQQYGRKSLLSIERNITNWEKMPDYNYKKLLF